MKDGAGAGMEISDYRTRMESSWVWEELKAVRNIRQASRPVSFGNGQCGDRNPIKG